MRNVAKKIAEDITNDAKNTLNRVTRHIANKVANDWYIMATNVMDDYYGDYSQTTMTYKRTFSLLEDSFVPVFWKRNNAQTQTTLYNVGIRFYPTRMDHGRLDAFNEEEIWANFMRGEHGNKAYDGNPNARKIAMTTPSPQSVLDEYYKNYDRKLDEYFAEAVRLYGK